MNKRIWKFVLKFTNIQEISMPINSEILTVQMQKDNICLWVLVNSKEEDTEERTFEINGTGIPFCSSDEDKRIYIGTVQMSGGSLIWHIFENL